MRLLTSRVLLIAALLSGCEGTISSADPDDAGATGVGTATGGGATNGGGATGGGTSTGGGPTGGGNATGGGQATGGGSATGGGGGSSNVDAGLELVHFIGRFDTSGTSPTFEWSGSQLTTEFTGTGVGVTLSGSPAQFAVIVDQGTPTLLDFTGTSGVHTLASGLSNGPHTVTLSRRTEAFLGPVSFEGFTVTGGALVASPPPYAHRIEVIGDSISCGYGDEGVGPSCGFTPDTENEWLAWGSLTARALGAEHHTVAWSGKGVYRNGDGSMTELIPVLYDRTIPTDPNSTYDHASWVPEVILIDLGTNDFAIGDPGAPYAMAYEAFVTRLRTLYPDAWIFCAAGPITLQYAPAVEGVVASRTQAGDQRIRSVRFPQQDGSLGFGCDYHPNLATHQQLADTITPLIRAATGW